jgi:hypothetical protein
MSRTASTTDVSGVTETTRRVMTFATLMFLVRSVVSFRVRSCPVEPRTALSQINEPAASGCDERGGAAAIAIVEEGTR